MNVAFMRKEVESGMWIAVQKRREGWVRAAARQLKPAWMWSA